jgi:hypothetical protein
MLPTKARKNKAHDENTKRERERTHHTPQYITHYCFVNGSVGPAKMESRAKDKHKDKHTQACLAGLIILNKVVTYEKA